MSNKDKEKVIRVIQYEIKPVSDLCLSLVNLSTMELNILKLHYRENISELGIAEKLELSRTTVQKHKKKALEKCAKAWSKSSLIKEILKTKGE